MRAGFWSPLLLDPLADLHADLSAVIEELPELFVSAYACPHLKWLKPLWIICVISFIINEIIVLGVWLYR